MGIELELGLIIALLVVGESFFGQFEAETAAWRRILKWTILVALTVGIYLWAGHWALLVPIIGVTLGTAVHFTWCRKNGIDPIRATPRRRYYELRGWEWHE